MTKSQFMKLIFVLVLAISLTSCAEDDYNEANILNASNANKAYMIICIDGIEYVRTHAGISGHFKQDGSLYTCNQNENNVNGKKKAQ